MAGALAVVSPFFLMIKLDSVVVVLSPYFFNKSYKEAEGLEYSETWATLGGHSAFFPFIQTLDPHRVLVSTSQ